jgi:DNA-binding CsgD family transcriptional regulator
MHGSLSSPLEKEVMRLHAVGKPADIIAIRLGLKMSRVIAITKKP